MQNIFWCLGPALRNACWDKLPETKNTPTIVLLVHCQAMEIFKKDLQIEMQLCRSSSLGKRENYFTGWRVCRSSENNFLYVMLIWTEKLSQIAIWPCLGQKIWKITKQCRMSSLILPVLGKGHPWIFPESIQDPELGTKKEKPFSSFLVPLSAPWANPRRRVNLPAPGGAAQISRTPRSFLLLFAPGCCTSAHPVWAELGHHSWIHQNQSKHAHCSNPAAISSGRCVIVSVAGRLQHPLH